MTPFDTALFWLDQNVATIPICHKSKRPYLAWKQYQTRLPTKHELKRWFNRKYVNIAIITGYQGLTIIDFDNWSVYELWKQCTKPEFQQTYQVQTSRGAHVYYYIDNPPDRTIKMAGIDVKAAGGYCLIPPSIHPSGHVYTCLKNDSVKRIESLEVVLPGMLLKDALKPLKTVSNGKSAANPWDVSPNCNHDNPIEWIKANVDILSLFPHAIPSGGQRWYKTICPLHDDHAESGWIDVVNQRYGCQACLNQSLDVIDLVCLLENVDASSAIRKLTNGQ